MGRKKLDVPRKISRVPMVLTPTIREYLNKRRALKGEGTSKHLRNLITRDMQTNPSDYGIS